MYPDNQTTLKNMDLCGKRTGDSSSDGRHIHNGTETLAVCMFIVHWTEDRKAVMVAEGKGPHDVLSGEGRIVGKGPAGSQAYYCRA